MFTRDGSGTEGPSGFVEVQAAPHPPHRAGGSPDSGRSAAQPEDLGARAGGAAETFAVDYRIECKASEIDRAARDLALEQTVEFPYDLLPDAIAATMAGRVLSAERADAKAFHVRVSYPVEATGREFTQFLNVLFGNTSLQPNVRVENIDLAADLLGVSGPRFGTDGVRRLVGAESRPLVATALKPLGLDVRELASLAHRFALGGIDIIKDDHGVTNQSPAPFRERVKRCAEAVDRANRETGGHSLYVANVSADFDEILERALVARDAGAGGLLLAPGLVGFSALQTIAGRDDLSLPIMSHPALVGGWLASPRAGMSHRVLLGTLQRLAGADMVIFPHASGRFSFTLEDCADLVRGLGEPKAGLRPALPVPAGGMALSRISEILGAYGPDTVLLIGGDLFRHGSDLQSTARQFRSAVDGWPHSQSANPIPPSPARPTPDAHETRRSDL
ncbi:MAG: RuBisCO large subunit C-terminal-like domain-containing protein [Polyangiaceae bacterium]